MADQALLDGPTAHPDRKLDPLEVYKLRLHNRLSFPQIAGIFGVSKQAAHECFTRFSEALIPGEDVTAYQEARTELLTTAEERLLASVLDPEKLQKASLNNVAYALTQIHTMRRLEQGKSTGNIHLLSQVITSAKSKLLDDLKRDG